MTRVASPFLIHVLTILGLQCGFSHNQVRNQPIFRQMSATISYSCIDFDYSQRIISTQCLLPIGYSMATVVSANLPIVSALVIIGYQISHALNCMCFVINLISLMVSHILTLLRKVRKQSKNCLAWWQILWLYSVLLKTKLLH